MFGFNPVADTDLNQTTNILDNTDEGLIYFNIQLEFHFISNYCSGFDLAKPNIFEDLEIYT